MQSITAGALGQQTRLKRFLQNFSPVHYDRGQIILFQGEVPRDAYILKSGIVKVYNIDDVGREQLIFFKSTYETFPFTWVMGQVPTTQYFYETVTECEIYKFPKERYLEFLANNKDLLFETLMSRARQDYIKTVRLNAVLHPKATDKLLHILHCLCISNGVTNKGHVTLNLPLSQQDFANMTGLTRETVSLEFTKLKKAKVLSTKQSRYYQVNYPLFKKYLNDQFLM